MNNISNPAFRATETQIFIKALFLPHYDSSVDIITALQSCNEMDSIYYILHLPKSMVVVKRLGGDLAIITKLGVCFDQ